jgi:protein phosphatase
MVKAGQALCVPGNHDMKLLQKLRGKDVKMAHGLADSVVQLEAESPEFRSRVAKFLDGLISHYVLDDGGLVVAHAGMKEEMQGRGSGAIRSFALFGETTGETDEFGLPVRYNWAADYRGKASVVYGIPECRIVLPNFAHWIFISRKIRDKLALFVTRDSSVSSSSQSR